MKTFIRWQGNKTKYLKHILPNIPEEYNTYIEPFLGSGALFLNLEPKNWIINDKNKDLINIWTTVKENPNYIINYFKTFSTKFLDLDNFDKKNWCIKLTNKIETLPFNKERARSYLILKFCSYMGHFTKNGCFYFYGLDRDLSTKNISSFYTPNYFKNLKIVHQMLNDTDGKIFNKDYISILKKAKKNDFVFLDPPYIEETVYQYNYNTNELLDYTFVDKLYDELEKLNEKGVKWLMTQTNNNYVKQKFKKYNISTYEVYRNITKSYKKELLIKNY